MSYDEFTKQALVYFNFDIKKTSDADINLRKFK